LEFRDTSRVSEAITAKRMKIDRNCQRRNCSPQMFFSTMYRFLWHRKAFLSYAASNNREMAKKQFFNTHGCRALTWC